MKTVGIDVGNLTTKVAVMEEDRLIASAVIDTTGNVAEEIEGLVAGALRDAGASREEVAAFACTGGGADVAGDFDLVEDEVTCVAAAAAYYLDDVDMVVDVGGQSITSILLEPDGDVASFMRNDKCASGSGRFLEVMSQAVGVGIDEIDAAAAGAEAAVPISSQCGVFAESEVITHVNAGERPEDIVAGLCDSVASIVAAQARRYGKADRYTLTGGVARIESVSSLIQGKLEASFRRFPFDTRLAASIGAALLAWLDELD